MSSSPALPVPLFLPDAVRQHGFIRFVLHPTIRYALAWLLALGLAAGYLHWAWHYFDEPRRRDGNLGHVWIDFGGQWLLGRMIVEGRAEQLYLRGPQRELLNRYYPREDEIPFEDRDPEELRKHDARELLESFVGRDDPEALGSLVLPLAGAHALERAGLAAVGSPLWDAERLHSAVRVRSGPLYPPVHAILFSPASLLTPRASYRAMQAANILFAFVAGLGVRVLLGGRVWWPLAATGVIVYPGFPGTSCLGQNAPITLAVLAWGWVLVARGKLGWAGAVWGLLAFKPTWGLAFFLVPLLTGRWRMCLTMAACGLALAVLTLPVVGWQSWADWLHVGRLANRAYDTDMHWIFLSRDLLGVPRRWLMDFSDPHNPGDPLAPRVLGWAMLLGVFAAMLTLALWRRAEARATTGPPAAFLFLGAWFCCFHFMYYDVLLTALPVFLLFADPARLLRPTILLAITRQEEETTRPNPRSLCLVNSAVLTILGLLAVVEYVFPHLGLEVFVWAKPLAPLHKHLPLPLEFTTSLMGTPWNTLLLLALWLWCGWLWLRRIF